MPRRLLALIVLPLIPAAVVIAQPSVVVETPGVTVEVQGPTLADPALAPPAEVVVEHAPAPMVAPAPHIVAQPAAVCHPIPVARYHTTLPARRLYRGQTIESVLCVDNPVDCKPCLFSVPVCVPCCCVGEPRVCASGVGLLGRGYVEYVWDCGFAARVVFRARGDAVVIYGVR